jgi:hypothetical protein
LSNPPTKGSSTCACNWFSRNTREEKRFKSDFARAKAELESEAGQTRLLIAALAASMVRMLAADNPRRLVQFEEHLRWIFGNMKDAPAQYTKLLETLTWTSEFLEDLQRVDGARTLAAWKKRQETAPVQ